MRKKTMLTNNQQMLDYNINIFEQHDIQMFEKPERGTLDREVPRANLYNVVKKLRESKVSLGCQVSAIKLSVTSF